MSKNKNLLFEDTEIWKQEWKDMPEFVQEDLTSYRKIIVHFKCKEDVDEFAKLIGQKISPKQPSICFPERVIRRYADKRYVNES